MEERMYRLVLESLLEMLDTGVYVVDKDGKGLIYNDAMAKMEKIGVEDVIGKDYNKAFPGVSLSDSTMFQALKKGLATLNKQQTYQSLYGKEIATINSTRPIRDGNEIIGAIEIAQDITNLRSMTDTIQALREKEIEPTPAKPKIRRYTFETLIGQNPSFLDAIGRALNAAQNDASVFIYGETGTGKELFAQSIHYSGNRKEKPFLAQNCAALPEALLEGILFGTAKGGFTGAMDRAGLFEQANGGTLLLDEISAMPYDLQSKLLRVLQEDYIRRVGGTTDIPVDTRIIATVNETPEQLIAEGKLRKDLYYRLNVVAINVPPLRNRLDDIPLLVETFLAKYSKRFGKAIYKASEKALEKLKHYDYPGNIRELENIIAQAVSFAGEEAVLTEKLLQTPLRAETAGLKKYNWDRVMALPAYMEQMEQEIIRDAMIQQGGNISRAAEMLKIKRQTLQHKLRKYDIAGKDEA